MDSANSIGMMDAGYFVGRKDIVDWINNYLQLNLAKIEQTANGAIACQMLDAIFPNQVPMHRVNWEARNEYDMVGNYKILQDVFDRKNITRHIEVQKLCHAKYQDNLEFMQWLKRFFELQTPASDYNPSERRNRGRGGDRFYPKTTSTTTTTTTRTRKVAGAVVGSASARNIPPASISTSKAITEPINEKENSNINPVVVETIRSDVNGSDHEVGRLKLQVEFLEQEKAFYFDKLREIEKICQQLELEGRGNDLISKIQEILYAASPDDDDDEVVKDEVVVAAEVAVSVVADGNAEETY